MPSDPYRYFRLEARELLEGLSQGVLALERGEAGPDGVRKLLRLAHTLKGAARVVKQPGIADAAHALEDALEPYRDGRKAAPADVEAMLRLLDGIRADLAVIDPQAPAPPRAAAPAPPPATAVPPPAAAPAPPPAAPSPAPSAAPPPAPAAAQPSPAPPRQADPIETVRVEISETDGLLEALAETGIRLDALRREADGLNDATRLATALVQHLEASPDARARGLAEELADRIKRTRRGVGQEGEAVLRELSQVRDRAERIRLVRADAVFPSLERAARDAAQSVNKAVELIASGGEHRLDGHVLAAVRDALLHVVRNAVDHGLEPEEDRLVQGKSPVGRVELKVERRGGRIAFVCRDDGRGVDVEAVRQAAVTRGLLSPAQARSLSQPELLQLLVRGGMSTARQVTQVSGRGVGLDVVYAVAQRFKGEVELRSEPGLGTTVELVVPVSLSSLPALVVEAGGVRAALPLDAVQRTLRLAVSELSRAAEHDGLFHEGEVIPFAPLSPVLGGAAAPVDPDRPLTAVVLRAGGRLGAVGVERLAGIREVYVKAMPPLAGPMPAVSGVSLDAEGLPQPMLDPQGVLDAAFAGRARMAQREQRRRPPVLIIDDSLTTRMLEQSILESAGYEVELATSAEEGLEKARARRYGVFIVDVDMPGMNGFEFVALTRADPELGQVPAILVTSRASPEDLRRGAEAGARAYIIKGEFDQGRLLGTLQELIG